MPSERWCLRALRRLRWSHYRPGCIYCGSSRVVSNGTFGSSGTQKFSCKKCGKNFNEKSGTPFQNSNVPLREWAYIATKAHEGEPVLREAEYSMIASMAFLTTIIVPALLHKTVKPK